MQNRYIVGDAVKKWDSLALAKFEVELDVSDDPDTTASIQRLQPVLRLWK